MVKKSLQNSASAHPIKTDWPVLTWMVLVHVMALPCLFYLSWEGFALAIGLSFVTSCFGITIGFHRLFSHRTFKVVKPIEYFFAVCGTLSMQGTLRDWVAHHRMHHAGSDTPKDPHNARAGFWHSHIGWLFILVHEFDDQSIMNRYTRDIDSDPFLKWISNNRVMVAMQVLLGIGLFFIGGWSYVFWGIFFRLVWSYHVTWFVNSAAHKWGYRNFEVNDLATNCWWVAILAWGEGWHNNHHAYGNSVKSGYRWWEFDLSYVIIKSLALCGLAWDLKYTMPATLKDHVPPKPKSPGLDITGVAMDSRTVGSVSG